LVLDPAVPTPNVFTYLSHLASFEASHFNSDDVKVSWIASNLRDASSMKNVTLRVDAESTSLQ
jgi:hypothetical protein